MADLITFILFFSMLCLVGCLMTKRTPRAMEIQQHELHQQHLREIKQWREDGRLPDPGKAKEGKTP